MRFWTVLRERPLSLDVLSLGVQFLGVQFLGVPFLGAVPLHLAIRETSDSGSPIVVSDPAGEHAKAYLGIADQVVAQLDAGGGRSQRQAPRILVQ